jgi:hypothetical protein
VSEAAQNSAAAQVSAAGQVPVPAPLPVPIGPPIPLPVFKSFLTYFKTIPNILIYLF